MHKEELTPVTERMIIPDAVHTDLYDSGGKDAIPFDRSEGERIPEVTPNDRQSA